MKITSIECLIADSGRGGHNTIVVRTSTDEGVQGIGEAYGVGPDMATSFWVEYFAEQLLGEDPTRIEFLWAKMYQGARFPIGSSGLAALSGIEHSLWDITGKWLGMPVYKLLGGRVRDRVRGYLDVHWEDPARAADGGQQLLDTVTRAMNEEGYTAFKTNPLPRDWRTMLWNDAVDAARRGIAQLREAAGPDAEIGLDAHAAVFEPARVLELSDALAEFKPMFMEEPLRMENRHAMGELRKKMPFALATGECLYTRYEFNELIREEAADILQPEICIVGGLSEMRKIAANAEAHDLVVAPHNPMGPLATMINIHFAAATPNFLILERRQFNETELSFFDTAPIVRDGYFDIPDKPGWGMELDEDALRSHPYSAPWHRGDRVMADGSVAYI